MSSESEPYSTNDIKKAPIGNIPDTGDKPKHELQEISADPIKQVLSEKGWIGHVLGARSEKSGNIAGLVVFFGLIFEAGIFFIQYWRTSSEFSILFSSKEYASSLVSLITLALGYLFGRNSRQD